MEQEDNADECHNGALLDQRPLQRCDRASDQLGAVVDRYNLSAFRQRRLDPLDLLFDVLDDRQRVFAKPLNDDAADHFALAIELGNATPFVGRQFHARHVAQKHRRTTFHLENDLLDVLDAAEVTAPANHELGLGQLNHTPANVHIGHADRVAHL